MSQPSQGHPKGLYILFFTEMWERFSYYGMRAIFLLYLTNALLYAIADASNIYGSFTGLVYLTPLLGGYISDKYWGNRRSILTGGQFAGLALPGTRRLRPSAQFAAMRSTCPHK